MIEPLTPSDAKQLIRTILQMGGTALPSRHAREQMAEDGLDMADVLNVVRAGVVEPGEWENGSWRYRVRTQFMVAVVAFRSETELRIVTVWRLKS